MKIFTLRQSITECGKDIMVVLVNRSTKFSWVDNRGVTFSWTRGKGLTTLYIIDSNGLYIATPFRFKSIAKVRKWANIK